MKKLIACAVFALTAPLFAAEAGDQGKYLQETMKHFQNLRELTIAVADAMPADNYGFKANSEEMSFGEQIDHIARANANYFSAIAGSKSPFAKPASFDKGTVTKELADSFDYCQKILASLKDADLERMVGPVTVRERMLGAFIHTAHHRGQCEVYLRLNNIKPPTYKF